MHKLYGIDRLIEAKKEELKRLTSPMTDATIRLREEVSEQIKALAEMKVMGEYYGLDLSRPATSAQEAVQWVYTQKKEQQLYCIIKKTIIWKENLYFCITSVKKRKTTS